MRKSDYLFDIGSKTDEHWKDMPEFKLWPKGYSQIIVHFKTQQDMAAFSTMVKQVVTKKTKSIWFTGK